MLGTKGRSGAICLALIAGIVAANYWLPLRNVRGSDGVSATGSWTLAAWLITLVAMVLMLRAIGIALNGRPAGIIIDNRNRISLSKAQMIGWTMLILSALVTLAATKLGLFAKAPASLDISNSLLALMGISATSLVAAPALLSIKPAAIDSRPAASHACWTDLIQGDDEANKDAVDISKVQQLLITLLVMGLYATLIGNMLSHGIGVDAAGRIGLPVLSDDLVWLIGISHAGYLAYKAAPHSSTPATQAGTTTPNTTDDEEGAVG